MSREPFRLHDYLTHILQAIERTQKYICDLDESGFLKSEITQDAVVRNFEIIGEASRNIERVEPDFIAQHPELPLKFAYDMRNQLAHGYFSVDLGIVWRTANRNLPALGEQIKAIVASMQPDAPEASPSTRQSSDSQVVQTSGLHVGPVVAVEPNCIGQKSGRDPKVIVWHSLDKLQGKVPVVGDLVEINYVHGVGVIKGESPLQKGG